MDWTSQAEEMARAWQRAQQQIWDGWLASVSGPNATPNAYRQTMGAWRTAVDGTLDAQARALADWARAAGEATGEGESAAWVLQGHDMMARWLDAQRQMWTSWFQVAATMDPTGLSAAQSAPADAVSAWRNTAKRVSEMQAEWLRTWSGAGGGVGSSPSSSAPGPSTGADPGTASGAS